ncbi:tRNA (adenosine(37)-N6)-dimethylallyltransferase MiaA [Candidatus Poribacteria bacterium]|nr:tRNA (adenosine(37)-N6)-dimethylallyltransferase MiaA [Candidatus Poribacteria bacterium]
MTVITLLLCILGPTAVGKTEIAIAVAQKLDAEIVSTDSRQIYRYMNIGTAKPSSSEQAQVRHHLIDCVTPDEHFSAADYQRAADSAIQDIQSRGKQAILVGGTGLYFRAVVDGLFDGPDADPDFRAKLMAEAYKFGAEVLHSRLLQVDPKSASRIHPNDLIRVIRALEVYEKTGKTISELQKEWHRASPRYLFVAFGINRERQELYHRIEERVDKMLAGGLLEEVKSLIAQGYDENLPAMKGFGYKELIDYLNGKYEFTNARSGLMDWDTAVDLLKRNTRRFAKRQLTWFRNDPRIKWINLSEIDFNSAVQLILQDFARNRFDTTDRIDGRG